mgnify:CR=1 FL=1
MGTMIKRPEVLNETYKTEDLLDFNDYIKNLRSMVDAGIPRCLVGIVGAYGTGKSVMLENYRKQLEREHVWIHIDAWKYPDRSDLWEGFVLDFTRQVNPKYFKKVLAKLDGTSKDSQKTLLKTLSVGAGFLVPGSDKVIDKLTYFARTSPAKRIFQIQDIFKGLLKDIDKEIYIVIEDADRSGSAGIYFIETLNQFLKELDVQNKVKVLIPIAETSFNGDDNQAYVKALDYIQFFDIENRSLEKFVDELFIRELTTDSMKRNHILETLQRLLNENGLTYRQLKLVIRNADLRHLALESRGLNSDPRVVLGIESSRFITQTKNSNGMTTFTEMRANSWIEHRTQLGLLLYSIVRNQTFADTAMYLRSPETNHTLYRDAIVLVDHTKAPENTNVSVPFRMPIDRKDRYCLASYYVY